MTGGDGVAKGKCFMRFPIRIEKKWTTSWFGALVLFAFFLSALWLGVYFLNELRRILLEDEITAQVQKHQQETLRFASGAAFSDSTPEKTLEAFIVALRAEDIDAAMEQVSIVGETQSHAKLEQAKAGGKMQTLATYYSKFELRTEYPGERRYVHKDADTSHAVDEFVITEEGDGRWRVLVF